MRSVIVRLVPNRRPPAAFAYAVAIAVVILAWAVRAALGPLLGDNAPLLVFVLAVTVSAWYGGLGPSLVTTLLSLSIGTYFFVPPLGQLVPVQAAEWVRVAIFAVAGCMISVLTESLRFQAQWAASQAHELGKSEARFRLLVDGLEDYAVYMLDPAGRITSWNAGAERITGYAAAQILGESAAVLCPAPPDTTADYNSFLARVTSAGRVVEEGVRRRRDGSLFWANVITTALRSTTDQVYGYAQITRDISERKEAEAALQASEKLFRSTFEQAAVGIGHVSTDGHWLRVNQRLCDIVGYSRDELLARTFQAITHPDDLPADLALVEQVLAGDRQRYSIDKRYVRSDGSLVWITLTVSLVRTAQGEPDYFISVVEDVSTRVAAETGLRELNMTLEQRVAERTEQLESANAELEAFAYVAAHDLRAPLRALQGFATALQEDYEDVLDPLGQRYAQRICDAARQMDTLVQDLLMYSQLGRAELPRQPVRLQYVIADACDQLSSRIAELDAAVVIEETPLVVAGHYSALVQVVTNLMANALTFVQPNVRPHLRVWAELLGDEHGVRCTRLWVEDNGIGIAPEHRERIFHMFERLHGVETYPGTGIGLAIVRRAVERIGGQVGVESEVGSGSRFWVALPLAEERR